jgi:DNA polymerase IV
MERIVLHIDMDAFYASVEQMDRPELRGKPVIVGGTSNRGVVSAASYEARKYGVRSAMPIYEARRKCPHGIFVPVRMTRYREVSHEVMHVLERYSPIIEQVSIDEAYMDISGLERLFGSPAELGAGVKQDVRDRTSLGCSVGIAPNKFLAKIASEFRKPDGLTIISPGEAQSFAARLSIERVPGVGRKTVDRLKGMGVSQLGHVRNLQERVLLRAVGKFGRTLLAFSAGEDDSPVVPYSDAKSISSEETLEENTDDLKVLQKELLQQAETVGRRLREKGLAGSTVTLKLKRADFTLITRSVSLGKPTDSTNTLYEAALRLLQDGDLSSKFRLIGLGVSRLTHAVEGQEQMSLFPDDREKESSWKSVEKAMDNIKERFGKDAIKRGGLLWP